MSSESGKEWALHVGSKLTGILDRLLDEQAVVDESPPPEEMQCGM